MRGQVIRAVAPAVGGIALLALAACESGLPALESGFEPAEAPRQTLASGFAQCSISHEYAPADAAGLAPDALGDGEVEWRGCAYQVLERALKPRLGEPAALDGLIAEDRRLTEAIAGGTATRADRSAAIGARLDVMQTHEQVLRQEEISEMSAGDVLAIMQTGKDAEFDALVEDLARVREAL
jgi:hypothetical protein